MVQCAQLFALPFGKVALWGLLLPVPNSMLAASPVKVVSCACKTDGQRFDGARSALIKSLQVKQQECDEVHRQQGGLIFSDLGGEEVDCSPLVGTPTSSQQPKRPTVSNFQSLAFFLHVVELVSSWLPSKQRPF